MTNSSPILVEVSRGGIVESFHRGIITVVDCRGTVEFSLGDLHLKAYLRSSSKPMQVLPLITSGAVDDFGFTLREIALMCGSHSGERVHIETVSEILRKIGLGEEDLKCGVHPPLDRQTRREMRSRGEPFTQLHNNCSAKHAGMLAGCVHRGYSIDDYLEANHPWQVEIIRAIAELAEMQAEEIILGVDGCGAPVHAMPMYNAALAGARLVKPEGISDELAQACETATIAMVENPYLVGGRERICTDLIRTGRGKIIAKAGAEGFYLTAFRDGDKGVGIAVKIDDGAERGRDPVVLETMKQLGVLSEVQIEQLDKYYHRDIMNLAGLKVGDVRTVFELKSEGGNREG